jgi:hypothetical protein
MSIIARTRPPVKPDRDNLAPSDAEPRTPTLCRSNHVLDSLTLSSLAVET